MINKKSDKNTKIYIFLQKLYLIFFVEYYLIHLRIFLGTDRKNIFPQNGFSKI